MKATEVRALGLCWLGYASTYLLRKPLGVGKKAMAADLAMSASQLGMLDTAMFVPYAAVQTMFGSVADSLGGRRTLAAVLASSACCMVTFGSWSSVGMLALLLFLNGASQSLGWGACVKAIASNFDATGRNNASSLFSTSSFVGGVVGTALAVRLLAVSGWRGMFFLPSLVLFALSFLVYTFLPDGAAPAADKQADAERGEVGGGGDSGSAKGPASAASSASSLSYRQLLAIPLLPEVTLAYLLVKLVRYAFYMWLPMYLGAQLAYTDTEAGLVAMTFEIGGVAGSAGMGVFLNRFFPKQEVLGSAVVLASCTASLVLFAATSSFGMAANVFWMVLAGAANCGVDPVLSGTLPMKMATRAQASGASSGDPTSQIAGFVNGIASMGAIIEGVLIGIIADVFGWQAVFYTMTALSLLTALILFRAVRALGA